MTTRPLTEPEGDSSVAVTVRGTDRSGLVPATIHTLPAEPALSLPRWRLLARTDAVVSLAALATADLLWPARVGLTHGVLASRVSLALACWLVLEVCMWARGTYVQIRRRLVASPASELGALALSVAVTLLVALATKEVLPDQVGARVPTDLVVVSLALCAVSLPLARALILGSYRDIDVDRRRVVIVGSGTTASDAAVRLERSARVQVVGFVDDNPARPQPVLGGRQPVLGGDQPVLGGDQPVLGGIDSLAAVCRHTRAGRVLVVAPDWQGARTDLALRSLPKTVSVHVVPPYVELTGWNAAIEDLGGLSVVGVDGGTSTPAAWSAKRVLDVAVALAGLVVLSPLLAAVALAVRLSSPGPVLFAQVRIGRHRAPFQIVKFRTMREPEPTDREDADCQEGKDARVTRVGRLLRRIGVDEFPQLWNILVGDMSLVGPRPLIPEETDALSNSVASRFDVRPGMTGLWQICGQHDLRWDEMCQLDIAYVSSWSFRTDLRILAATPKRLFQGGGTIGDRWQPPTP